MSELEATSEVVHAAVCIQLTVGTSQERSINPKYV